MTRSPAERVAARIAVVDEHVRCENRHDLGAVMATFGGEARYDDEPWGGIFSFDAEDRLAGERIYYDRGVVLGQLGLFHEPLRGWRRIATALSHPFTVARAYLRPSGRGAAI